MGIIGNTVGGQVVWSFASQLEVAEGVALVVLASALLVAAERSGLSPRVDHSLQARLDPRLSQLCTSLGVLGALSFGLLAACNFRVVNRVVDVFGLDLVQYPLRALSYVGGTPMGPGGRLGYGALALVAWIFAVACLSLGEGVRRAARLFAAPSILFLSVLVLVFDPGQMDIQAVNIASGATFEGVSLVSNWSLFVVSLSFTALGLARGRPLRALRKSVARLTPSAFSTPSGTRSPPLDQAAPARSRAAAAELESRRGPDPGSPGPAGSRSSRLSGED
ncbi:MAG: hypothetical protein JRN58_06045 [Nitrososphaerota archaeon]|jgi:hypothetical protein|nr:hypothetical protein [Nitrososphaerota archaeon]MDG6966516.1 hypothetical protein [Nitrososphaerota archaeon]MDG6978625.1 hypothetical protein [Nitrososphaerota archaeon]